MNYSNPAMDRITASLNMTGPEAIATAKKILRESAEESFFSFFKQCWRLIERQPFTPGWHIEAMAEHCEAIYNREITKLLINIPPRSSKSILVSVAFPAWVWVKEPSERFLCLSYAEKLAEEHSQTCRDIIQSEWYQENWGDKFQIRGDKNTKLKYDNTETGRRISASVDGVATGFGGTINICFPYDQKVRTSAGDLPIGKIVEEGFDVAVATVDELGNEVYAAPSRLLKNPGSEIVRVLLSDGSEFECTPDHRVMTMAGWEEAANLKPGDVLPRFPGSEERVVSVNHVGYAPSTYCLTIPQYGKFLLSNGVLVRNCDDLHNLKEIHSKAKREAVIRTYRGAVRSRENQPGKTRWIAVMQRGHEEDISAVIMREEGWEHLIIPQEFDPARRYTTSIGWTDPRTERGELMCPERFSRKLIEREKGPEGMGSYNYAAQHQQDPRPSSGGCFERQNFRWFTTRPEGFWCQDTALMIGQDEPVFVESVWQGVEALAPHPFDALCTSWDLAVKGNPTSSWSVGGCWGRTSRKHALGVGYFLWDLVRKRVEYGGQKDMFSAMLEKHPGATLHYVEDKALGPALISEMKSSFSGIVAVDPRVYGSKEQRARAVSPLVNDGRLVWLPHFSEAPWIRIVLDELSSFPLSASNDIVDMMSQVLMKLRLQTGPSSFRTSAPTPSPDHESSNEAGEEVPRPPKPAPVDKGKHQQVAKPNPRRIQSQAARIRARMRRK